MASVLDALSAVAPVLAAAGGAVAGLVAIFKNIGRLRKLLGTSDRPRLFVELRELADTRLEMIKELRVQLDDERTAHEATRGRLEFSQRSLDDCDRQRQNLYERLYRIEHSEDDDR